MTCDLCGANAFGNSQVVGCGCKRLDSQDVYSSMVEHPVPRLLAALHVLYQLVRVLNLNNRASFGS